MADIAPIGSVSGSRMTGAAESSSRLSSRGDSAPVRRSPDRVELSTVASLLSKLRNLPVRSDLVDTVRQQIEAGTYETDVKIDGAIDEVIKDLG